MAATMVPKGIGFQNPTKKLAHWVELMGQQLSQKNVFENLGPEHAKYNIRWRDYLNCKKTDTCVNDTCVMHEFKD